MFRLLPFPWCLWSWLATPLRIWKLVLLLDLVILTVSGVRVLPLSLRYWLDLPTEI